MLRCAIHIDAWDDSGFDCRDILTYHSDTARRHTLSWISGTAPIRGGNFYVYVYLRAGETDAPYYVGKGRRGRALEACPGHNPPKDRSRIRIFYCPDEYTAFAIERYLIDFWGRKDQCTGCLENHTDGGEGACNPPKEAREAMRAGGRIGGMKAAAHVNRSQICRQGGRIGGRIAGKIAVISGSLAKFRTPEHQRIAASLSGIGTRKHQADKGRHTRWHVNRGIVAHDCRFCCTANGTLVTDAQS
jgi:hypothetical protein